MKHFPLDAGEREKRNIDDRDNHDAEKHRRTNLFARGKHRVYAFFLGQRAPEFVLALRHLPHDVFHDDHRPINDEAEINCAQAHQVPGDAEALHAQEREQKRKGNGQRDNERRAPVAEEQ